ncbi:MAG: coagulation factor 5/8 type domain protein [Amycolatopsis sp.]|uniref:galactose-binding domain-containing protein n=1 Tax=Amycolatopsis sp. TaxID=37632 RepID=UPI002623F9D8|nr:discoidin domain-containing protein [Amycolatopsis sp.]MCU1679597.1 coagulation factor 5/8 type domain protein [Amycolatopsis sp.]
MSIRDGRLARGLVALGVVAAAALAWVPSVSAQPAAAPAITPAAVKPAAAQPAAVPAPPSGFTTTWSDDFSGAANSALDTGTWRYDAGPGSSFGTGEIETTTTSTSNVYEDGNGHLVLKALHSGTDPNAGWTSGRVETQADGFGAQPGGVVRIQASIQQPNLSTANGAGYWPAFWMLGAPLRVGIPWPGSGEVDAMEDINGRSSVFGTLHCGVSPGGACNESTGVGSGERACGGCQTGYHTYAVEIDRSTSPEQIRWYLDGASYFTLNSNQMDATSWANAVDHSFFIIFDLAIGGAFPAAYGGGPNAATASGGQLNVDYLAVYNKLPAGLGTNVAQGKPTTASSAESAQFPASNATDGNVTTRWSSGFSDPQWVQVDLGQNYNLTHATVTWEAAAASSYQLQRSTDGTTWTTITTNNNSPADIQDLSMSGTGRYVRIYATSRASQYGDSLYELAVYGTLSSGGNGGNTVLSQGKTATASSAENTSFTATNAVDGNTGTRWSSAFTDPQWLEVDLGASHSISQVVLNWEAAYATAFQIQTSADGSNWTTVYTTTTGTGGTQTLPVSGTGRYVRMNGTARATQYGYSLWEFQVLGT